jgi:hypothetical protein
LFWVILTERSCCAFLWQLGAFFVFKTLSKWAYNFFVWILSSRNIFASVALKDVNWILRTFFLFWMRWVQHWVFFYKNVCQLGLHC